MPSFDSNIQFVYFRTMHEYIFRQGENISCDDDHIVAIHLKENAQRDLTFQWKSAHFYFTNYYVTELKTLSFGLTKMFFSYK